MQLQLCEKGDVDEATSAGIMPFALKEGEVYFLLAQERTQINWKGSLRWSSFEGGRKAGESAQTSAAREFLEESMGVVNLRDWDESDQSCASIARHLDERCAAQLLVKVNCRNSRVRYHLMYLALVTYRESLPSEFDLLNKALLRLNEMNEEVKAALEERDDSWVCEGTSLKGKTVLGVLGASRETDTRVTIRVRFDDADEDTVARKMSADSLDAFMLYISARSALTEAAARVLPHPSVTTQGPTELLSAAEACRDYLEKCRIRFWSQRELENLVDAGGCSTTAFLRPFFMPHAKIACQCTEHLQRFAATCLERRGLHA